MYHCQYSCPCSKLRDPLDYGPDRSASRNVAKRTLGNKFTTMKRRRASSGERVGKPVETSLEDEDVPLLGVEDIDPDFTKEAPGGEFAGAEDDGDPVAKPRVVTSARTLGAVVQSSSGVKLPYSRRQGKARNRGKDVVASTLGEGMEEILAVAGGEARKTRRKTRKSGREASKGLGEEVRQEVATHLSLEVQPR